MANAIGRSSAPTHKKKPRHTTAQKQAAARARELKARQSRPSAADSRSVRAERGARPDRTDRPRWQGRDDRPTRDDRPDRTDRPRWQGRDDRPRRDARTAPDARPARVDRPRRQDPIERRPRPDQSRAERHTARHERLEQHHDRLEVRHHPAAPAVEIPRGAELEALVQDGPFARLGLDPALVRRLAELGIVEPFPIQSATIPDALAGHDLLGRGQTGSGKTMAFGLPTVQRLAGGAKAEPNRPRALILTPTRELAMQVIDALAPLLQSMRMRHVLVAGGMSYTPQLAALDRGVELVVATPGRLMDLIERGAADLSHVQITVLDEADHMAQMGFLEAITEILDLIPREGQRLLFSATLDHGVAGIATAYLHDPVTHETDAATASVATMEHHFFLVHPHHKKTMTAAIANRPGRTLVFVRTKLGADRVAEQLRESGVFAAALHGGLNQAARTRVLGAFRSGELPVLVATDVAARGIHVDDVTLVLQADPPADHKDYLHRSGRTARAGDRGAVVTLALPHQRRTVSRLLEAAGVDTRPQTVAPEDDAVLRAAGARMPSGESIPQARLDDLLRPRRDLRARRPGRSGPRRGTPRFRDKR